MGSGNYNIEVKRLLKEKEKNMTDKNHWIERGDNLVWAVSFIVILAMFSLLGLFYLIDYIKN